MLESGRLRRVEGIVEGIVEDFQSFTVKFEIRDYERRFHWPCKLSQRNASNVYVKPFLLLKLPEVTCAIWAAGRRRSDEFRIGIGRRRHLYMYYLNQGLHSTKKI